MKKIKKFLRKLKNDAGSSIVMVVVSIAFIGIIVGALLAAAVQSYRLKLQELNARDNFYYVEQAMNEIYAGVGSQTMSDLRDAYEYTLENMVYYDLGKQRYVTRTQEQAQKMFSAKFYDRLQKNPFFTNIGSGNNTDELASKLEAFISNDTVHLDSSRLCVENYTKKIKKGDNVETETVGKIIRNVKLTRTQNYNKNSGSGTYVQTITTDIVVGDPDFSVLFDAIDDQDPNIFKYALVADMGVVVDQKTTPLTIAGNIYAASDYYNKQYNASTWDADAENNKKYANAKYTDVKNTPYNYTDKDGKTQNLSEVYVHNCVTSKSAQGEKTDPSYTYFDDDGKGSISTRDYYNGENIKSKYSGFYVNGSQVSVVADTVVVPGTMAVMNDGSLSVYGKSGDQTAQAEVWTDSIVMDGYSTITKTEKDGKTSISYAGASAIMKANLFVKDDTELNAVGSTFDLSGSYFGYGDSTEKDDRKFTGAVNTVNFQEAATDVDGKIKKDKDGKVIMENRGHYNSSAIIINGEQSTINLSQAKSLFLAGRTYIELSKDVDQVKGAWEKDTEKTDTTQTVSNQTVSNTYTYHPVDYNVESSVKDQKPENLNTTIQDYKTGESISTKSNQLAYIPVTYKGTPTLDTNKASKTYGYYMAELPPALQGVSFFETYFPKEVYGGKVPCVLQMLSKRDAENPGSYVAGSGKKYYFYDFNKAYNDVKTYIHDKVSNKYDEWIKKYPSSQYFATGFITDYYAELKKHADYLDKKTVVDSEVAEYLVDISAYEDFQTGDIILPDTDTPSKDEDKKDVPVVYSSGALTTKSDTTFSIITKDDINKQFNQETLIKQLLTSAGLQDLGPGNAWCAASGSDEKDYTLANSLGVTSEEAKQYTDAYQLSNDLEMEYNIMKWNLGHLATKSADADTKNYAQAEYNYIQDLVNDKDFGSAMITPINKFVNMSEIVVGSKDASGKCSGTHISPDIEDKDDGTGILKLASGYSVWVSDDDVVVKARKNDNGKVRGIVVTKGNVYFSTDKDYGVTDFEGMIIAGGKVYVNGNVKTIAANAEICRTILRECMMNSDADSKKVCSLFRGYEKKSNKSDPPGTTETPGTTEAPSTTESSSTEEDSDTTAKSIGMIDYTDVVSFSNWSKNVE